MSFCGNIDDYKSWTAFRAASQGWTIDTRRIKLSISHFIRYFLKYNGQKRLFSEQGFEKMSHFIAFYDYFNSIYCYLSREKR